LKLGTIPPPRARAVHGTARLLLLAAFSSLAACGGPSDPTPPPGGGGPGAPDGSAVAWGFFAYTADFAGGLTGARLGRFTGILWDEVERPPGTGNYDWSSLDNRIGVAQTAGMNRVLVLKTGNGAAFSDSGCLSAVEAAAAAGGLHSGQELSSCPLKPGMESAWSRMVGEVVERYDGDGNRDMPGFLGNIRVDIQIENEAADPALWNYDEKDRAVAADRYLRLLELSYQAKQTASPATQVILAGITSPNLLARCDGNPGAPGCNSYVLQSLAFNKRILTRPQVFDAVDVHFFVYYHFEPGFIDEGLRWANGQMQQGGYQRPVYSLEWTGAVLRHVKDEHIDEFLDYFPYGAAFPTLEDFQEMYRALDDPDNVIYREWFEAEQAKEFGKLFPNLLAGGVRRLVHVQYSDYHPGSGWDSVWWNFQGIIKYVGGVPIRKPSYYTYGILSERLSGFTGARRIAQGNDVRLYEFTFANRGPTYVLWTEGPGVVLNLSSVVSSSALRVTHMVTSLDGANQPVTQPDVTVPANAVPAGDVPVLLAGVS
jgi:hypothetical protein